MICQSKEALSQLGQVKFKGRLSRVTGHTPKRTTQKGGGSSEFLSETHKKHTRLNKSRTQAGHTPSHILKKSSNGRFPQTRTVALPLVTMLTLYSPGSVWAALVLAIHLWGYLSASAHLANLQLSALMRKHSNVIPTRACALPSPSHSHPHPQPTTPTFSLLFRPPEIWGGSVSVSGPRWQAVLSS
jgi:hypothetical protein